MDRTQFWLSDCIFHYSFEMTTRIWVGRVFVGGLMSSISAGTFANMEERIRWMSWIWEGVWMRSGVELFDSCEEISEWSSVCVMSGVNSLQACVCHFLCFQLWSRGYLWWICVLLRPQYCICCYALLFDRCDLIQRSLFPLMGPRVVVMLPIIPLVLIIVPLLLVFLSLSFLIHCHCHPSSSLSSS